MFEANHSNSFDNALIADFEIIKIPALELVHSKSETNTDSPQYSRKEKSLGQLCKKFLIKYGDYDDMIINLEECSKELKVEKRRIYDIINILECFNVLHRTAKNTYSWNGLCRIEEFVNAQIDKHHNVCNNNIISIKTKREKSLGYLC